MEGYLKDRGDGVIKRLPPIYKAEWDDKTLKRIIGAGKDIDAIMSVGGLLIEGTDYGDIENVVYVTINGKRIYDLVSEYTYNLSYINTVSTWKGATAWACVDGDDLLNVMYRHTDD